MSKTKLSKFKKIVSGGQAGVDRAAIDFAIKNLIPYGGWCPKGGLAEDYTTPPGILKIYPEMKETPSSDTAQRTEWNVRDSDATIIIFDSADIALSLGTKLTKKFAEDFKKPLLMLTINDLTATKKFCDFVMSLNDDCIVNIAGPRESESDNIYFKTFSFFEKNRTILIQ